MGTRGPIAFVNFSLSLFFFSPNILSQSFCGYTPNLQEGIPKKKSYFFFLTNLPFVFLDKFVGLERGGKKGDYGKIVISLFFFNDKFVFLSSE